MGKDRRTFKDHGERIEHWNKQWRQKCHWRGTSGTINKELALRRNAGGKQTNYLLSKIVSTSVFCHLNYRRESQGQKGPDGLRNLMHLIFNIFYVLLDSRK